MKTVMVKASTAAELPSLAGAWPARQPRGECPVAPEPQSLLAPSHPHCRYRYGRSGRRSWPAADRSARAAEPGR